MNKNSIIILSLLLLFASFSSVNAQTLRPLKYYGVDRGSPISDANYQTLKNHAVTTIIVDTYINDASNSSNNKWANIKTMAARYNFNYVIWPNQGGDVAGCRWEYPFNNPQNGDYIWRVKTMLDFFASDPHFIGLVSEHEPASAIATGCHTTIEDMAAIKTQLKDYLATKRPSNLPPFKVWNYIDNIGTNLAHMSGYKPADIFRVMDVAVTWEHCFSSEEGACGPEYQSGTAWYKIKQDRAAIQAAGFEGQVELVYLFQTFKMGSSYWMPTSTEMNQWSCAFLKTNALDGFMYYTWGAWYDEDLMNRPDDLQPLMNTIYDTCVNKPDLSISPTIALTNTPAVTLTPIIKPGDANSDTKVDGLDFSVWLTHYKPDIAQSGSYTIADFNKDSFVDGIDYSIWLTNYGK